MISWKPYKTGWQWGDIC